MSGDKRWSRPASVPVPRVWRRCTGRTPVDGVLPRFVIQDVPDDLHEAMVTFMSTYFAKDEPMCSALQMATDAQSMTELKSVWRETLKQHVAIVALLEGVTGPPVIVGCNLLGVHYRADNGVPNIYKGVALRKFVDTMNYHNNLNNPFEKFDTEEALVGFGLSINPAYRGQGLGLELMRARFDLGRAVGLRLTYTLFSAIQSQSLAAKVGMEVLTDVLYKDYKLDGEVVFADITFPPNMKMMGMRIE